MGHLQVKTIERFQLKKLCCSRHLSAVSFTKSSQLIFSKMGDQISKNPEPQFATVQELVAFKKARKFRPRHNEIFGFISVGFVIAAIAVSAVWKDEADTYKRCNDEYNAKFPPKAENVAPVPTEQHTFVPSILKQLFK